MTERVAILHDKLQARGGAEHVAFELAREFDAPILAGVVDDDIVPEDVDAREVFTSRMGERCMDSHYLVEDLYQMQAWQHVDEAYRFDTLIINKTNPGWFVPRDDQTTVWYLHSTPRGLYDQFHRQGGHWLTRLLKTPMRPLYLPNTRYADAWACNSELVQRRMDRYWDIPPDDVNVIYPPVDVTTYDPAYRETGDYYLTFSRLRAHKRIDEIVQAFNQLDRSSESYRLIVGGDGPERDRLEDLAGDNIEFRGYLDEDEKRRLLAGAQGFVFNAENEDFGIVPIEAMASGTPVIGVRDGFTQHQIINGKNGVTYARQGGHLREAIRSFHRTGVDWSPDRIEAFADRFSADRFRAQMRDLVDDAQQAAAVAPGWRDDVDDTEDDLVVEQALTDGGDR